MSKSFPSLKPRQVIKALEKLGYVLYRQKGSHKIYVLKDKQVIVPYHSKDLKKGTLVQIIKGTGLCIEEFKKYL